MKDAPSPARHARRATCRDCRHFEDDPARLEAALPHLGILSSAWGSTRGSAGLCSALDRFHDPVPAAGCPAFAPRDGQGSSSERIQTR